MDFSAQETAREKAVEVIFEMPYNRQHLPNPDYVDFLKRLNRRHFALKSRLAETLTPPEIDKEKAFHVLRRGISLLSGHELYLPDDILSDEAGGIIEAIIEAGLDDADSLKSFESSLAEGRPGPAELIGRELGRDEEYFSSLAERADLQTPVVNLVAIRLAAPLMELYAEPLAVLLKDQPWRKGFCPICGAWAGLAVYAQQEGRRHLVCRVCRTEWPFTRIECPFCNETNQSKLAFLYADDIENPYRADVCNSCMRAIKAIDLRKWNAPEAAENVGEHMAAYYFDLLAEKKGYRT